MENNNQDFFQQFSDQLRLHQASSFSNLSINDSIWSANSNNNNSFTAKKERRNFDIRVGAERSNNNNNSLSNKSSDLGVKQSFGSEINGFNNGWKISSSDFNGGFSKGVYLKPENTTFTNNNSFNGFNKNFNSNGNNKVHEKGRKNEVSEGKNGRKNNNSTNNNNGNNKSGADKRFKTLPPSESLPRGEMIGGYIFVCNNDTMQENLQRQLFGLPPRYRDSVRAITPGLPLFLYNYSDHQLHGVFEASSFGGANIDPTAWEDKKSAGESRFPAQVRVATRKICNPLEEDSFRPILHHYDGPKFRLELSVPEALALLDVFAEA